MAVGLHTVKVFPDPAAGGWSAPIASNPYLTADAAGWTNGPFTPAWTWAGGAVTGGTALSRSAGSPVPRVAAGAYRLRVQFSTQVRANVFWGVNFGTTPTAASQGPFWMPADSVNVWDARANLPPGTYTFESTWDPTHVDPRYLYLGPYVQFTAGQVARVDTMELRYQGSGGFDLSCLADTVTIHHGRDDADGQPEASAATIDLTTDALTAMPADVEVGAVLSVTTTTERSVSTRFVGRITDVSLGWDDAGEATPDMGVGQIVATGYLADLGRRVVGDTPYPQELDGARVSRVLTAAGVTLDPLVSDPGTVQLLARDVDSKAALEVAHDAAGSASGILWATRGGEVRYADADHRRGTAVTVALDACDLLVTPTWRRNTDGLVNSVSVGYGATPDGGEQPRYVTSDAASITKFGTYAYTGATDLAALADAQAMGRLLLTRNSSPVWVMAALPVDVAGLDAERYDALLVLDVHALVTLSGLPAIGAAPTSAALWVEGWRETLTYGRHDMELVVSGYCRTAPPPRWDDLPPSVVWGGPTLTETRRNLITNPSMEVDTVGWAPWGSGTTIARQAGTGAVGNAYLRCTTNAGTNTGAAFAAVPAVPGVTYGARAMSRLNAAAGVSARLIFADADGAQLSVVNGPTTTHPTSAWGLNTATVVAPPGTATVQVLVNRRAADAAGQLLDVDAVVLYGYTTGTYDPTYFDGSTPPAGTLVYAWAGNPHASESVESNASAYVPGVDPELTWDAAACLGPPSNYGRWNDQPASLRWDQVAPAKTWNTYA